MSSSASKTADATRKQQRQARFFSAISSTPSQPSSDAKPEVKSPQSNTQQKTKVEAGKAEQGKSSAASTSTPPKSTAANALSPEEIETLMRIQKERSEKKPTRSEPIFGKTLEEQKEAHRALDMFWAAPAHVLPPDLLAKRDRITALAESASSSPLSKLKTTPMKSLPPELQQLKRETATQSKELELDDAFGITDIKRRMSKLMRDNGEPEFKWEEMAVNVHNRERSDELHSRLGTYYTSSLQRRKPKVFAQFMQLLMEYIEADEPTELIDW